MITYSADGNHEYLTPVCGYYVSMPFPSVESQQGGSCMSGSIFTTMTLPVDENGYAGNAYYRIKGDTEWIAYPFWIIAQGWYQYGHNGGDALDRKLYEVKIEFLYGLVDDNNGQYYLLDLRSV